MIAMLVAVLVAVLGYVLGSIPSGLIVGRVYRGMDVRDYGSGKTGFTNTLRSLGWGAALIVVIADMAKGAAPVLIGRFVFDDSWGASLGGIGAVAGHSWPLFAGFRGGRGVATAFGAFTAVTPVAGVVLLLAGLATLAVTRYASLMSVAGTAVGLLTIVVLVAGGWLAAEYLLFGAVVAAIIELNHIGNIRRLLSGVEPKIGQGGAPRAGRV